MKTVRLLTFVVIAVLVFSAWTPSLAYAKASVPDTTNQILAVKAVGMVKVYNGTGGTVMVDLKGSKSYYFWVPKQGWTTSKGIEAGSYTATLNTSACRGRIIKKITITAGGTVNLGKFFCQK
jgi:hypothetical protein